MTANCTLFFGHHLCKYYICCRNNSNYVDYNGQNISKTEL